MIKFVVVFLVLPATVLAGPIFPTRGFLVNPKWYGHTDTTAVFDHAGYWAQVQRGFGSDSDRWGWAITMGAIWEFARYSGDKSLFAITGMELIADTHNDITFNPHGALWEEGLMYAVHQNDHFDWQVGAMYRCRHDIDNGDPQQYSDVFGGRTLIYCSLSGKAIWKNDKLFGLDIPTNAWLHADAYVIREDYRIPQSADTALPNYKNIAWSFGEAFDMRFVRWTNSGLYGMLYSDFTAFSPHDGFLNRFGSIAKFIGDGHAELGYEFHGRAGRLQVYAGWEAWQDDGQTPIPRNTSYLLVGIRTTGTDLVTF